MLNRLIRAARARARNAWHAKQAWARLPAPVATFTFDDFPHTAWSNGAPIIESFGARATYFVAGIFAPDNLRQFPDTEVMPGVRYFDLDDIVAAHAHGHEIGCHTFDHRITSVQDTATLEENILRNASFVENLLGDVVMTSFAYPRGDACIRAKRFLSRKFAVCRGTWPGINASLFDLSQLKCFNLDANFHRKHSLSKLLDDAKASNGWIIFNTHDVCSSPSPHGCTPDFLHSVVAAVASSGIEILPMKNALGRVIFRQHETN